MTGESLPLVPGGGERHPGRGERRGLIHDRAGGRSEAGPARQRGPKGLQRPGKSVLKRGGDVQGALGVGAGTWKSRDGVPGEATTGGRSAVRRAAPGQQPSGTQRHRGSHWESTRGRDTVKSASNRGSSPVVC